MDIRNLFDKDSVKSYFSKLRIAKSFSCQRILRILNSSLILTVNCVAYIQSGPSNVSYLDSHVFLYPLVALNMFYRTAARSRITTFSRGSDVLQF